VKITFIITRKKKQFGGVILGQTDLKSPLFKRIRRRKSVMARVGINFLEAYHSFIFHSISIDKRNNL
jgi:hypothetical protein